MKPRLVLLYTRDHQFDPVLSEALRETEAVVLIARSVKEALQIVCRRGRELDLAVFDFNDGCHGMALLSAVHASEQQLPVVVASSNDVDHTAALAYANGARICLDKPVRASTLANAIADLDSMCAQPVAA